MIVHLSERIVSWQVKKNILTEDDKALYQYGYEVLINQVINILLAILIAIVLHAPMTVSCFLLCYIPLRSFCGGYHAKTHERCTVVSVILTWLACGMTHVMEIHNLIFLVAIAVVVSGIAVFTLAPVPAQNKPLDKDETVRYRKIGRLIWIVEAAICIAFIFILGEVAFAIASTHLIFSFMLFLGSVKNRNK